MLIPTISMAALPEGETTVVPVNGAPVLLCHLEGQFFATSAICPHAGQSLAAGRLRNGEISCPLHGARFDVRTGACTRGPSQAPLQTYPVLIEAGKLCVQVD